MRCRNPAPAWSRAAKIQGPIAQWRLADSVGSARAQEPFNSSNVRSRWGQLYSAGLRFQAEIGEGRGAALQVHVRALSWILAMRRRAFDDLDLKLYRKLFGGIAGRLVAGLILQLAANHIARRNHAGQRTH